MSEKDRAKLEAVVKEAECKAATFEAGTSRWQFWTARGERYNAELAKLGGDSGTGIETKRNGSRKEYREPLGRGERVTGEKALRQHCATNEERMQCAKSTNAPSAAHHYD